MIKRITLLMILLLVTCAWCPEGVEDVPTRYPPTPPSRSAPSTGTRHQRQHYGGSCVFAAFACVTGIPEQSLIDDYKASGIGLDATPEFHGMDPGLLARWLNTQGYSFQNVLWFEHGTTFHEDWEILAQGTNNRGVVISGGHAWVFLGADTQGISVWDPESGRTVRLLYTGVTDLFLPIQGGFEDYDDYEKPIVQPRDNKVLPADGRF